MSDWKHRCLLLSCSAVLLLAGCEATSPGGSQANTAPPGFECPVAGTRVTFQTGGSITYRGTDPSDPAVCIVSTSADPAQRRLLNFLTLPNVGERSLRSGLGSMWPLEPGKTSSFSRVQQVGNQTVLFRENWRVERAERATIAGTTRDVLVMTRSIEGASENNNHLSRITYSYDPNWRMFLSSSTELIRGSSPIPPFTVTEVRIP